MKIIERYIKGNEQLINLEVPIKLMQLIRSETLEKPAAEAAAARMDQSIAGHWKYIPPSWPP